MRRGQQNKASNNPKQLKRAQAGYSVKGACVAFLEKARARAVLEWRGGWRLGEEVASCLDCLHVKVWV